MSGIVGQSSVVTIDSTSLVSASSAVVHSGAEVEQQQQAEVTYASFGSGAYMDC